MYKRESLTEITWICFPLTNNWYKVFKLSYYRNHKTQVPRKRVTHCYRVTLIRRYPRITRGRRTVLLRLILRINCLHLWLRMSLINGLLVVKSLTVIIVGRENIYVKCESYFLIYSYFLQCLNVGMKETSLGW